MSTKDGIGGMQVLEEVTEAEKATAEVVQHKLLAIEEVIEIEDDPEPPITEVDPIGVRTTQRTEAVTKAGDDRAVTLQAAPKKSSLTIKPLYLTGEPSLKLRRSSK